MDGDVWCIVDGAEGYGYVGGNYRYSPDGTNAQLIGSRALYTPKQAAVNDSVETFRNLAIQEAGHCFLAGREHGDHRIQWPDLYTREIFNVSPTATAYTHGSSGGDVDTDRSGSATAPDEFCDGLPNKDAPYWCGTSANECRHDTLSMTQCTMEQINSNTLITYI